MQKVTLLLGDDALCETIEEEVKSTGWTEEEVIMRALYFWQSEKELDAEEQWAIEEDCRDWQENGGMDAKEFFDSLREEENAAGR
jgi:hypothetical protein